MITDSSVFTSWMIPNNGHQESQVKETTTHQTLISLDISHIEYNSVTIERNDQYQ
jgi:hypothetical protein